MDKSGTHSVCITSKIQSGPLIVLRSSEYTALSRASKSQQFPKTCQIGCANIFMGFVLDPRVCVYGILLMHLDLQLSVLCVPAAKYYKLMDQHDTV